MKKSLSSISLLALTLSAIPVLAETPDEMLAAAKELDRRFIAAYNGGDVEALMATYWKSPDLVSYPPGAFQARGWDAARKGLAQELASMAGAKLELTEINYMVAGDVVIGWGTWKFTMPSEGGEPMVMIGRYTDVKAKRDGKWVYILDHASVPLPPPGE